MMIFSFSKGFVMQHPVVCRQFEAHDQDVVRQLILNGLGEHYGFIDETRNPDIDNIQENYINTGATFLVAQLAERIVGTGALIEEEPKVGRIVRMSVDSAYRRHGIGRTILQQLIDVAQKLGYTHLKLETNSDWHNAIAFYISLGFTVDQWTEQEVHMSMML